MNTQKPEPLSTNTDGRVELHSIFATIQGEGIFAGDPATFVRLAGCNLKCPACDTEYTSKRELTTPAFILEYCNAVTSPNRIVVITGGEPFRQDISLLVATLVEGNFRVQIETNGTLAPTYDTVKYKHDVYIMCSPKVGRIHKDLVEHVSAYKYVISHKDVSVLDGLPTRVLGLRNLPARPPKEHPRLIFVQPMDSHEESENIKNLEATKRSALKHGYCLCLQIHKIINME
jgi:organic radical activating enzyme